MYWFCHTSTWICHGYTGMTQIPFIYWSYLILLNILLVVCWIRTVRVDTLFFVLFLMLEEKLSTFYYWVWYSLLVCCIEPWIAKQYWERRTNQRHYTSSFQTMLHSYSNQEYGTGIKTHIDQWNRIESPKITHVYMLN